MHGDISSKAAGALQVLSNFSRHPFVLDGVECGGMEGFLQGLKFKDEKRQREVCAMHGWTAKKTGKVAWKDFLFWKGKPIERMSPDYARLVGRAYVAMAKANKRFVDALMAVEIEKCTHLMGAPEEMKFKTVLSEKEFIKVLSWLKRNIVR